MVTRSEPGSTGLEKRTASRARRVGSPLATVSITARLHMAIVHSPWRMIPGSPTPLANSSSRWIRLSSPEAAAYRQVWSASTLASKVATDSPRPDTGNMWSGRSGPLASTSLQPRTNMVPNCSSICSPESTSTLTARTVTHVPARDGRTEYGPATVASVDPGTSGPENRMSWPA